MTGLTVTAPVPDPLDLPPGHDRQDGRPDSLAAAVRHLAGQRDWAGLDWPELVQALESLGRTDIPLSRLTEGHVDALRIHAEAGTAARSGCLYGVWASRSRGTGIRAERTGGGWRLEGTLRFASGAGLLERALVPVWLDDERSVLLDLDVSGWPVDDSAWQTSAMRLSHSHTIHLDHEVDEDVQEIGDVGFYLGRPGFFPGGIGVAAVWVGGAARVVDLVRGHVGSGGSPSPAAQLRLGHLRTELVAAASTVAAAAGVLASGPVTQPQALAAETRAVVGASVRRLLEQTRAIAGPAGLALDGPLTRAVDDLDLYVRQQSTDGDALFLGGLR